MPVQSLANDLRSIAASDLWGTPFAPKDRKALTAAQMRLIEAADKLDEWEALGPSNTRPEILPDGEREHFAETPAKYHA